MEFDGIVAAVAAAVAAEAVPLQHGGVPGVYNPRRILGLLLRKRPFLHNLNTLYRMPFWEVTSLVVDGC